MDGKSLNLTQEKLNQLKDILPEAFTEDKIDWEKLKAALGEDVLYELLLKSGVSLTAKIEEKEGCYLVDDGEMALILEKVDEGIVKAVIATKPNKVITIDRLFNNNDRLKTNTDLQMKDAGIEFKVV